MNVLLTWVTFNQIQVGKLSRTRTNKLSIDDRWHQDNSKYLLVKCPVGFDAAPCRGQRGHCSHLVVQAQPALHQSYNPIRLCDVTWHPVIIDLSWWRGIHESQKKLRKKKKKSICTIPPSKRLHTTWIWLRPPLASLRRVHKNKKMILWKCWWPIVAIGQHISWISESIKLSGPLVAIDIVKDGHWRDLSCYKLSCWSL
jgi:hypothetical protein